MCNFKNARLISAGAAWVLGAAISVCAPSAASPAAETGETAKLEEIIVTAQRREQNLQDVGTSVTAFDANSVERLGLKDVTDIVGQVPGMQFNQYGATVTVYNLRGVSQNDFSDHQEAPIAVYSDDAYIANTGALAGSLFDLQRVEVLRGPQGTLFGRNATGGLIQYVSKQPTDAPEGYVQVTAGNYGLLQTGAPSAGLFPIGSTRARPSRLPTTTATSPTASETRSTIRSSMRGACNSRSSRRTTEKS